MSVSKTNTCYLCGSVGAILHEKANGFDILKCPECKLLWVDSADIDSHLKDFYTEGYFSNDGKIGYKDYLAEEGNHRSNAKNLIDIACSVKDIQGARVIDIGCAFGFLIDGCRKLKNCEAYGVETSRHAYEYAKNLGLNVINSEFSPALFAPDFFDAAFLIGTIEHLTDPRRMLKDIRTALKPGGLLVITTLDTSGILPLYSLKPPEHLFYFNHDNLKLLLESEGYRCTLVKTLYSKYRLHDLLHRLGEFSGVGLLNTLSTLTEKFFPSLNLRIPTNEIVIVARKTTK